MTDLLKTLLHEYGILYVSLSKLEDERPGNPHASLNAYYETMGIPYEGNASVMREKLTGLGPEERVLVVRISPDGSTEIRGFDDGNASDPEEEPASRIAVWELPEDEFYFFKAFRQGLFDLEKQVPAFLLQMAFVYAYTLFETYLRGILKLRFQTHPEQIGRSKQIDYAAVFDSVSKEEIMARIIDRELTHLLYEPIESLLDRMRNKFGFRTLSPAHDEAVRRLSLTRNCLIHNAGKVSEKLAKADGSMIEGDPITIQRSTISDAINTYRKFCLETDQAFESLAGTGRIHRIVTIAR
jgi:hypothetical protein